MANRQNTRKSNENKNFNYVKKNLDFEIIVKFTIFYPVTKKFLWNNLKIHLIVSDFVYNKYTLVMSVVVGR